MVQKKKEKGKKEEKTPREKRLKAGKDSSWLHSRVHHGRELPVAGTGSLVNRSISSLSPSSLSPLYTAHDPNPKDHVHCYKVDLPTLVSLTKTTPQQGPGAQLRELIKLTAKINCHARLLACGFLKYRLQSQSALASWGGCTSCKAALNSGELM